MSKLELISFNLCPFVQRSVITLLEKKVPFDITYIDLTNKPDWFLKISPFGKVPVLKVAGTVLFESAVINEYIDETQGTPIHPQDPLRRAFHRAWIEFSSGLIVTAFQWSMVSDEDAFLEANNTLMTQYERAEEILQGPFFDGETFSLVDAAFAPLFLRQRILDRAMGTSTFKLFPKLSKWCEVLCTRDSVKKSVIATFQESYLDYIRGL